MARADDDGRIADASYMRLNDLREWHVIEAQCWKCKHVGTISHARLKRGRPIYRKLIDIAFRMRCTNCGVRGAQELTVRKLPRNT